MDGLQSRQQGEEMLFQQKTNIMGLTKFELLEVRIFYSNRVPVDPMQGGSVLSFTRFPG